MYSLHAIHMNEGQRMKVLFPYVLISKVFLRDYLSLLVKTY